MPDVDRIRGYLASKAPYIEEVARRNVSFMEAKFPANGRVVYQAVRASTLREPGSFSATIPWIIADLCGVRPEDCVEVASSWECILLYARQLDCITDKHTLSVDDKRQILAASTLLVHGIDLLGRLTRRQDEMHLESLYESAKFQRADIDSAFSGMATRPDDITAYLEVMTGKNLFVGVLFDYYLERSDIESQHLNTFVRSLAAFAQIIDDVKDIDEDIANATYSHLMGAVQTAKDDTCSVLITLVANGSLARSLDVALGFLRCATTVVSARESKCYVSTQQIQLANLSIYLEGLYCQVEELLDYLNEHIDAGDIAFVEPLIRDKIIRLWMGT